MLNVSREVEDHVIDHVSDHVISWDLYQKGVQTTFLKELMNILNKGQSRKGDI